MGKVIALMNEKGGVGKSSLTYSSAWLLAESGKKVLIVDMDGQMANVTYISGVETDDSTATMNDVLLHNVDVKKSVLQVNSESELPLYIIPANTTMADAMTTAKISKIKKVVKELKDEFDYIFFDVNPAPDWKHALTLSVVDYVGIVMLPDVLSLEANVGIVDSITEIKDGVNPGLKVMGIILNQYNSRTNLGKAVQANAEKMAEYLDTKVFDTKIRKAVVMGESVSSHKGVTSYAPKSDVAGDIIMFVREMELEVQ